MLKERLNQLFTPYDPIIQTIISEMLVLEQTYISMRQPHLKEATDQIVSRLASKELERLAEDKE